MFDTIIYPTPPANQPKLTTDYLLRWYQREFRTAATAEARASVCRNAQHDGYSAAQFAGTAVSNG